MTNESVNEAIGPIYEMMFKVRAFVRYNINFYFTIYYNLVLLFINSIIRFI